MASRGFDGSRRGSLRRAGTREAASEAGDGGAQAPSFRASPCSFVSPSAPAADMAAVLQQVLERSELNKLPKSTQNKLEKFLADQQSEIDGLKGRHERFKVESEQQYFEIEKRLSQSQERLVNETRECQNLRLELEKLNNQVKVLTEKNKELETAQDRNLGIQSQFTRAKEELEAEKRDLIRTNERLSQEVEYLTGMNKCLCL